MLQLRGEQDLALEPLGAERRGESRMEDLQGDGASVFEILSVVDRGHPATPEFAPNRVAVAEGVSQRQRRVCQDSPSGWGYVECASEAVPSPADGGPESVMPGLSAAAPRRFFG